MYLEYVDTANALVDSCNANHVTRDLVLVQEKLNVSGKRWLAVKELAEEKKEQIQEAQEVVKKFQSIIAPYEDTVKSCEKSSRKPRSLGSEPENLEKYLTKLKVRFR